MTSDATFLFADIAGFTALTEAHGDLHAADLAGDFFESIRPLLPEHGAEEVKTIGDALMLRCCHAPCAIRLALTIVENASLRSHFPALRVGMHTGSAVGRNGDYFGSTINIASRICGLARGGEVLLTHSTHAAAGDLPGVHLKPHSQQRLRNLRSAISIFQAFSQTATCVCMELDPVCRMLVDPVKAASTIIHNAKTYHFCSSDCIAAFRSEPEQFIS